MSLKLKDEDSTKRMKDMQEELKDPSLGEFSDLEQDPYVIESKRTTPIDKPVYQPDGKLSSSIYFVRGKTSANLWRRFR